MYPSAFPHMPTFTASTTILSQARSTQSTCARRRLATLAVPSSLLSLIPPPPAAHHGFLNIVSVSSTKKNKQLTTQSQSRLPGPNTSSPFSLPSHPHLDYVLSIVPVSIASSHRLSLPVHPIYPSATDFIRLSPNRRQPHPECHGQHSCRRVVRLRCQDRSRRHEVPAQQVGCGVLASLGQGILGMI
ncbi:uncharacterized protein IWZ02DRAFT_46787 [Phyllosticta citriasiana]|uniref:uncharacterized protein n=1 Tax=Phyllosticta citriasiana TaxID=595635 RepID=UPI0030FDBA68